jgi:4-hydroxy-2-oxoheptanedioate aldolase
MENRTKELLRQGKPVIGTFIFHKDPAIVEIAGLAGLDFVIIDTEHTSKDIGLVENMVRAADASNITPLVRVHEINEKLILRVLETNCQGIVIPFMSNSEEALLAANAIRYPPEGSRGLCTVTRAASYGIHRSDFMKHVENVNKELLLVGIIENPDGVENIESILNAGVEVALVGRADLSSCYGVPAEFDHPDVVNAVNTVFDAASRQSDRWSGIGPYTVKEIPDWISKGCRFIAYSVDTLVLLNAWRDLANHFRDAVAASDYT